MTRERVACQRCAELQRKVDAQRWQLRQLNRLFPRRPLLRSMWSGDRVLDAMRAEITRLRGMVARLVFEREIARRERDYLRDRR